MNLVIPKIISHMLSNILNSVHVKFKNMNSTKIKKTQ